MCVNHFSKVALDSAAAGIEPAISSRKFNALTTTPPSRTKHTSNITAWYDSDVSKVTSPRV